MKKSQYNENDNFISGQYIEYDHSTCPIYFDIHIEKRTGTYWITGYISYTDFTPIEQHIFSKDYIYTAIDAITDQMQSYATTGLCQDNPDISQHEYINLLRYIQLLRKQQNQKNIAQYVMKIYHHHQHNKNNNHNQTEMK